MSFFDHPTALYNFLNLTFSGVGVVLGVAALIFAFVQINKTLNAAVAAQRASEATANKFAQLNTLMDIQKLVALSGETLSLTRSNNFAHAAIRAHDLRIAISQFRNSKGAQDLANANQWQLMIAELSAKLKVTRTKWHSWTTNE